MTRLFGTDGIRVVANEEPLTPELAFRVGRQLVATLQVDHGVDHARIVIGRDTRRSGPLLEAALVSGALSAGADCFSVGVLPTPGIALLTRRLEAHGGIVLSASHNPFEDNGIKLFSSEGTKFPGAWEAEIEQRLDAPDRAPRARGAKIGASIDYDRAEAEYAEFLCACFPLDLSSLTVAVDCAHGATYRVAPRVFRRLGARVLTIGARPDGVNINAGFGALHPEKLQARVRAAGASIGFAFDGDGDRLIPVDLPQQISPGAPERVRAIQAADRLDRRYRRAQGGLRAGDGGPWPRPDPLLGHRVPGPGHDRGRRRRPHPRDGRRPRGTHPRPDRRAVKISGVGVDLVSIPRMRTTIDRWQDRFVGRVFTDAEIAYCRARRDPAPHFAARFAAKEAGFKALGTGLQMGVRWRELEVRREREEAPTLVLSGRAREIGLVRGASRVLLSLTHEGDYALAQAILVGD